MVLGLVSVEVVPLPKSQVYCEAFCEVLVKLTIKGEQPESESTVKEAVT